MKGTLKSLLKGTSEGYPERNAVKGTLKGLLKGTSEGYRERYP